MPYPSTIVNMIQLMTTTLDNISIIDESHGAVRVFQEQLNEIKTFRSRQNGRHFADDIFKCIFVNDNIWIPIGISLNFIPNDLIDNVSALVQNRRQAIIWTNDGFVWWRIYASLGLNEIRR